MQTSFDCFNILLTGCEERQLYVIQNNRHICAAYLIAERSEDTSYISGVITTHLSYTREEINFAMNVQQPEAKPVKTWVSVLSHKKAVKHFRNKSVGQIYAWNWEYPRLHRILGEPNYMYYVHGVE